MPIINCTVESVPDRSENLGIDQPLPLNRDLKYTFPRQGGVSAPFCSTFSKFRMVFSPLSTIPDVFMMPSLVFHTRPLPPPRPHKSYTTKRPLP